MPDIGNCLALRFSVSNQSAVHSNELPWGNDADPDVAVLKTYVDNTFGGQMVKASKVRFRLKESEKAALDQEPDARYTRFDISGTFGDEDDPSVSYGFYLTNLHASVTDLAIIDFIKDYCLLPDETAPTRVFLGLRQYRS